MTEFFTYVPGCDYTKHLYMDVNDKKHMCALFVTVVGDHILHYTHIFDGWDHLNHICIINVIIIGSIIPTTT